MWIVSVGRRHFSSIRSLDYSLSPISSVHIWSKKIGFIWQHRVCTQISRIEDTILFLPAVVDAFPYQVCVDSLDVKNNSSAVRMNRRVASEACSSDNAAMPI